MLCGLYSPGFEIIFLDLISCFLLLQKALLFFCAGGGVDSFVNGGRPPLQAMGGFIPLNLTDSLLTGL